MSQDKPNHQSGAQPAADQGTQIRAPELTPTTEGAIADSAQDKRDHGGGPSKKPDKSAWRVWFLDPNGVVAVATVFALLVIGYQACLMRQSNEATKRALELTQRLERASVVVENIGMLSLSSRFAPVTVRIRNVGRIPAQSIEISTRPTRPVELSKITEVPCDRWTSAEMVESALGPGQETTWQTPGIKLTQDAAYKIHNRYAHLFLWFDVHYVDAIGPRQHYSCFVITGTDADNSRPPANPWRRCAPYELKPGGRAKCDDHQHAE